MYGDTVESIIKTGGLVLGVVGLAECLKVLTGKYHAESNEINEFGIKIINEIKNLVDEFSEKYNINFSIAGAEDSNGEFIEKDKILYGIIKDVTDKDSYTAGCNIPIDYKCSLEHRAEVESPYHEMCKAGNVFKYVTNEKDAIQDVIDLMDKYNLGNLIICSKNTKR